MNIEKIKNYNQKLLALFGTIIIIMAVFGLISVVYLTVNDIIRSSQYTYQEEGILSDEKIEELQQEKKRKQIISYEIPILVDSVNFVYMIPVSHKTLNGTEDIDDGLLAMKDYRSYSEKDYGKYSSQYYGNHNNLLIYDLKTKSVKKLFDKRINFGTIRTEYFKDDILILFEAASKDTYKDGVVNLLDYKTLYIYSLKENELREVSMKNTDIFQIDFIGNSKDLLISFGIDYDKNGQFVEYNEPLIIKKYNFSTRELETVVSNELDKELQQKLEGTKN